MAGGVGIDRLVGRGGDDILIGGTVTHAARSQAMTAILDEWTRFDTFARRVGRLRFGRGLNGTSLLNFRTVRNDFSRDTLNGGAGLDWFWAFLPADLLADRRAGEVIR